ncbi:hypothetical protein GCM10027614_21780 [Micromonospora vulcania]
MRAALAPVAEGRDPDTLAELGWSLLHGVVMLTRGGRLRPEAQERREAMVASELLRWPWPTADVCGKVGGCAVPDALESRTVQGDGQQEGTA